MQQLVQSLKDGEMKVLEVPFPALSPGHVLVRNHFSVVSAGTEGKTVRDARLGYIGKARARKRELAQVVESVKVNGFSTTYQRVMNRLEAPSALGYSCAGEVIAAGPGVSAFSKGDRVACAGRSAVHAEVVAVPANLCVKVPEEVPLRQAAFATIGAIAMQGVRRAEPGLGGNAVVVGLGLVGLLTVQLLEASGVQVIGIDIDADRLQLAAEIGAGTILHRSDPMLEDRVRRMTRGQGTDAVLITAGTASHDPVDLAGVLCRKKGRVVIVGSVPTGFNRAHYYKKELDLLMSCSYGPGRYDKRYEEKGLDYPIGYVRWTENRNMLAFVDLLSRETVNVEALISHTVPLERAADAYQMILDKSEPFTGIVLQYETSKTLARRVALKFRYRADDRARIGLIGAGSFAHNVLLPALKGQGALIGIASASPNNARYAAEKYGFDYCTGEAEEVLSDDRINTVFITTRHDLHAPLVLKALQYGKHVFVEKPLCLTASELEHIRAAYAGKSVDAKTVDGAPVHLMAGFNRRFAPHVQKIKSILSENVPAAINYRINAGTLPPDHWVHDPEVGGGRIVGEVCHFIDLVHYLTGADADTLAAHAMADPDATHDTVTINIGFSNGSTASIAYFSNGNKRLGKERLEVFAAGEVAIIDDFKRLALYGKHFSKDRLRRQDKGHQEQIARFLHAIRTGSDAPISFNDICRTMNTTFAIEASMYPSQPAI